MESGTAGLATLRAERSGLVLLLVCMGTIHPIETQHREVDMPTTDLKDLNQPRITFTGLNAYGELIDLFDDYEREECDGACVSLVGATHVAEFELMSTTLGPRYIVTYRKLLQMTHYPEDVSAVGSEWLSADAFVNLADAQKYYAELVTTGAARWVESLHSLD